MVDDEFAGRLVVSPTCRSGWRCNRVTRIRDNGIILVGNRHERCLNFWKRAFDERPYRRRKSCGWWIAPVLGFVQLDRISNDTKRSFGSSITSFAGRIEHPWSGHSC